MKKLVLAFFVLNFFIQLEKKLCACFRPDPCLSLNTAVGSGWIGINDARSLSATGVLNPRPPIKHIRSSWFLISFYPSSFHDIILNMNLMDWLNTVVEFSVLNIRCKHVGHYLAALWHHRFCFVCLMGKNNIINLNEIGIAQHHRFCCQFLCF